ncbi:hypothetical protein K440DRAFT_88630 [Wilcoxina mikolae CBS 423.85]|nr:hypothetical protein K440DRAFT_88630 [Wilcoxina mikolae CBS 423.85]
MLLVQTVCVPCPLLPLLLPRNSSLRATQGSFLAPPPPPPGPPVFPYRQPVWGQALYMTPSGVKHLPFPSSSTLSIASSSRSSPSEFVTWISGCRRKIPSPVFNPRLPITLNKRPWPVWERPGLRSKYQQATIANSLNLSSGGTE